MAGERRRRSLAVGAGDRCVLDPWKRVISHVDLGDHRDSGGKSRHDRRSVGRNPGRNHHQPRPLDSLEVMPAQLHLDSRFSQLP